MYQRISQIKASSRKELRGHFGMIIAAIFVTLLIILLINIPFRRMLFRGILGVSVPWIIAGIGGVLIVAIVFMLLNSGFVWIHLCLAQDRKVRFLDVFHSFTNRPGKFIGNGLLRIGTVFVCLQPALICLILSVDVSLADFSYSIERMLVWYACNWAMVAGLIVSLVIWLSWSVAPCLILEDPDMRVIQALRESRRLLKGNKRRRFFLFLSFILLYILSFFTFFIALLWVIPYIRQSMISFYLDLQSAQEQPA